MALHKIEPHLHTNHVSKCGWLDAETIAKAYKEAGYDAIIVTDHYNRTTYDFLKIDTTAPGDKVAPFLDGYKRLKDAGEKIGLHIFKGAELRFDECDNDYLFYGYQDDILAEPEDIFRMGIAEFSKIAHREGCLLIQAHPYRKGCTPAIARYIDGIEVYNANPRHDSRNELAALYAEEYGLITTAGSDCHRTEDIAISGLLTKKVPSDDLGMMRLIRSRNFELLLPEKK